MRYSIIVVGLTNQHRVRVTTTSHRHQYRFPFLCPVRPRHGGQATGVSDVNEVIQKMVSQESTAENLMLLTKENQVLYCTTEVFY